MAGTGTTAHRHRPGAQTDAEPAAVAVCRELGGDAAVLRRALLMFGLIQWLQLLLTSTADVSAATAGAMLSMFDLVGLPHSFLVPMSLVRTRRQYLVVAFAAPCVIAGPLGLAFAPHLAWAWIVPSGLGAMFIPVGLTWVNLRTRTEKGATQLSSFVQGVRYLMAGAGPILAGYLHTATSGWIGPCLFPAATGLLAAAAGVIAVRPVCVEDDAESFGRKIEELDRHVDGSRHARSTT